jgi:DNA-directed RNA polymerase I and III subunit RPAC2
VELCGYSIPHPSENHLNIRIQIYRTPLFPPYTPPSYTKLNIPAEYEDETRPVDALLKGLDDLSDLCDIVKEKFVAACDEFGKCEGSQ